MVTKTLEKGLSISILQVVLIVDNKLLINRNPQGIDIQTEQDKNHYEEKKRTHTSREDTQTQSLLLVTDVFPAALEAVPPRTGAGLGRLTGC